jgi:DNA mismatch repair protein MLH3
MVDQHAADERIRVETLWRCYNPSPQPLKRPITCLVSKDEETILALHIQEMREWGFEFGIISHTDGATIDVLRLPSLVLDRCATEPKLIITLLRTWISELKEASCKKFVSDGPWTNRMISATKVLGEVVSSRACRSKL